MKRPDENTLRAILNLRRSTGENFETLVKWLKIIEAETQKENRTERDEVVFRWKQGILQCLDHVLKTLEMDGKSIN